LAGQGIGLLTRFLFAEHIAGGRLVQVFDTVASDGNGFHLVYPEANASRPKIRAFRDWLLPEMKAIAAEGW
jgi:LysR family glycine cleavage system transcriptional activator